MDILSKTKKIYSATRDLVAKSKIKCNVAVTGTARSGKTAFIVSLLAHFDQYDRDDPNRLRFPGTEIGDLRGFKIHPSKPLKKRDVNFPYRTYHAKLSGWEWPEKTIDCSRLHCTFSHICSEKKRTKDVDLTINDLPGERISDMLILDSSSYEDWSDRYLKQISEDIPATKRLERSGFGDALKDAQASEVSADKLLNGFKRYLLLGLRERARNVSPSTFVFDTGGQEANELLTDDDLVAGRFAGLPGYEFAPLGPAARRQHRRVAASFRKGFKYYRREVLSPLLALIRQSDTLVILVDVPFTLMHGVSAFKESQYFLEHMASVAADQRTWFFGRRIKRALILASKDDMVLRDDIDKLGNLARKLAKRATNILFDADIAYDFLTCSAIVSTDEITPGGSELCGLTKYLPGTTQLRNVKTSEVADAFARRNQGKPWGQIYRVPELPDLWPEAWKPSDYAFVETLPLMPHTQERPPPQRRLDMVVRYLLNLGC